MPLIIVAVAVAYLTTLLLDRSRSADCRPGRARSRGTRRRVLTTATARRAYSGRPS